MKYKKIVLIALSSIFSIGGIWGAVQLGNSDVKAMETKFSGKILPLVKVEQVRSASFKNYLSYPGKVSASKKAILFFRVSGPLIKVDVKPGDVVNKGQLLMQIDPRDFKRNISQLTSQIKSARAKLKAMQSARIEDIEIIKYQIDAGNSMLMKAKLDYNRYKKLFAEKVTTEYKYEQIYNNYNVARAELESLKKQLQKAQSGERKENVLAAKAEIEGLETSLQIAKDKLDDTQLSAPFDGIITDQFLENYEMVTAGSPVIGIHNISTIEISIAVPEIDMHKILLKKGNKCLARFCAAGDKKYPVTLYEWKTSADSATSTYKLVFRTKQPKNINIFPGMTAEVSISTSNKSNNNNFAVPISSLFEINGNNGKIWIVDIQTRKAQLRNVELGDYTDSDKIIVKKGLLEKDWVVTAGTQFVRSNIELRLFKSDEDN